MMSPSTRGYRLTSIDMLRGLAIVIMAIDHVRDYFMVGGDVDPMADRDIGAALFFTRWITHFCAPVFVFLAGTSAGLMTGRRTPSGLGAFLLTRGLWLIVVEWFVVATAWSFAPLGMEQLAGRVGVVMQVNVTKYPPSLLFLLMPLGPAAMLCALANRVPDAVTRPLIVFGRAPFAFYVAHLYLIHALAVAFGVLQGFDARGFLTYSFFFPTGYGVGLPGVYLVWLLVIAALYPLCQWVAAVKSRRQDWWLSYL